jgi:hypothetical protein
MFRSHFQMRQIVNSYRTSLHNIKRKQISSGSDVISNQTIESINRILPILGAFGSLFLYLDSNFKFLDDKFTKLDKKTLEVLIDSRILSSVTGEKYIALESKLDYLSNQVIRVEYKDERIRAEIRNDIKEAEKTAIEENKLKTKWW